MQYLSYLIITSFPFSFKEAEENDQKIPAASILWFLVNRLKQETSDFLTSHDCHWMCQAVITGL
jgi:hypothetical protein